MPLQKLTFRPGIDKDTTATSGEGRWFDADKVRFRNGFPEKIGGWVPVTQDTFLGTARALISWAALDGTNLVGVGTHRKYYLETGGAYYDITPIRRTVALTDPLGVPAGSTTIVVTDPAHGAFTGDFVTLSGAADLGGIPAAEINQEHEIDVIDGNTYAIQVQTPSTSTVAAGGGSVTADYQVNSGLDVYVIGLGWGADGWGDGGWGDPGVVGIGAQLQLWNHANFGQRLLYGPRAGPIYTYDPTIDAGSRGYPVTGTEVPLSQDYMLVSDVSRFVIVFGTNDIYSSVHDPMLVRWSDQEDYTQWEPAITNQAGSIRLSDGSYIVTALQSRQEILVWTNSALYSMQYVGPPFVWSASMLMNNLSIMSPRAAATVNNVTFWMGVDKFYVYNGRVDTVPCTLRNHIFNDINRDQAWQVFAGVNEGFDEVWWFYCSAGSEVVDRYVIYNYVDNTWSHGGMSRSAWLDSAIRPKPMAATLAGQLVYHEVGNDDGAVNPPAPMQAYVQSSDIDIQDGDKFGFVWRLIPDLSFSGSTAPNPMAYFAALPRTNPGRGYSSQNEFAVRRTATIPVEQFTEYVYTRVRGRQMAIRVGSDAAGTSWRLGTPRIDVRTDGRKT